MKFQPTKIAGKKTFFYVDTAGSIEYFIHKVSGGYVSTERTTGKRIMDKSARSIDKAVQATKELFEKIDFLSLFHQIEATPKAPTTGFYLAIN